MIRAVSVYQSPGSCPAQEDHLLVQENKGIFVVADGFGGPVPGAEAARTACEAVRSFLFKEAGDLDATLPFELRSYFSLAGNVLFNSLIHANRKVLALNKGRNVHEKGGASVLAAFLDGSLLALANIGGCGAWLFRGGRIAELVVPRTYGRLADPFDPEAVSGARIPLMAVGMAGDLEPEIYECRIEPGDWLLLHTHRTTPELRSRLAALQAEAWSPEVAAEKVIDELKSEHFKDNASFSLTIF
ncbi:MAG: protein phosphatase 2C domain-containing protein [Oligoflexia bacterium]|nr:protein phosphatase 2C domain-containing protein [Oligoflexia bacterium]